MRSWLGTVSALVFVVIFAGMYWIGFVIVTLFAWIGLDALMKNNVAQNWYFAIGAVVCIFIAFREITEKMKS